LIADGSPAVARLLDLDIEKELTHRGYRVYIVRSTEELAELTAEVPLDLAIVDASEVGRFESGLATRTESLPVLDVRKGHPVPVLDKKYAYTLKVPGEKSTNLLSIDYAIQDARQGH
jgi:hypothetical protein